MFFVLSTAEVYAATVPPTCDTDYWEVMKARAWEGGEREMTQNRNIIAKSDSVLSFCFDDYMDHLAEAATHMFPGNPQESSGTGGGFATDALVSALTGLGVGLDMNGVLENLIVDTLVDIHQSFGATFLGDRSSVSSAITSVSDTVFNCAEMNQIWEEAKCYNFMTEAWHDGFYVFDDYVATQLSGNDYREHIRGRMCTGIVPPIPWSVAHAAANPIPGGLGAMDLTTTYMNLLDPTACGSVTPVDTGVEVTRQDGTTYQDAICIAPGCWYGGASGGCNTP